MTAALKIEADAYRHPSTAGNVVPLQDSRRSRSSLTARTASKPSALRPVQPPVKTTVRLPSPNSQPLWLQVLVYAQKGSAVLMISSVAAMLLVYGWTVQVQDAWGQEYRKLQNLLRQERQLTTSNEALKQQIAEMAEDPEARMALPVPSQMLFLDPAPVREPRAVEARSPVRRSVQNAPLGY